MVGPSIIIRSNPFINSIRLYSYDQIVYILIHAIGIYDIRMAAQLPSKAAYFLVLMQMGYCA